MSRWPPLPFLATGKTMLRVVATNPDSSVAIIVPSPRCVAVLKVGGARLQRDWEIEKLIRSGMSQPLAEQWIDGLMRGGYDERAAVALIGEFSRSPDMTALAVVDASELPDRKFRPWWRRSQNGGPIWIDEEEAMWGLYARSA